MWCVAGLLMLAVLPLRAVGGPKWDPIPPEVWTAKDTSGLGGAVLVERLHLENEFVERTIRCRVYNERGRSVAEFPDLPEGAYDVAGRTVYPDGKEVLLDPGRDLRAKTAVEIKGQRLVRKVLVPPGISSDCVVDVRWREKRRYSYRDGFYLGMVDTWIWASPFPIELLEVELSSRLYWSWTFNNGDGKRLPTTTESKDFKTLRLGSIPPRQELPFAVQSSSRAPRLEVFPVDPNFADSLMKDEGWFWADMVVFRYRPIFERGIVRGQAYKALSEKLRKGLTGSPLVQAGEIVSRIYAEVQNLSALTYLEKAALKDGVPGWEVEPFKLDVTATRRATNGWGTFLLAFSLFRDAGLSPKLALVADRNRRQVSIKDKNPLQFTDLLLGVEEPGKGTVWMDPTLRYATPGLLDPKYQGSMALVIDTTEWQGQFMLIGHQASTFNLAKYAYRLEILGDQDRFKLDVTLSGYPEYSERIKFMALEPASQSMKLRERLELLSKDVVVTRAEVSNATSPRENLKWAVEGRKDRVPGRRMEIEPFPLMPSPLTIPNTWPETREEMIVFPYKQLHLAVCDIRIPKGYRWSGETFPTHANTFGLVGWKLETVTEGDGELLRVILRVEVKQSVAPPSKYAELKEFVGWVEAACRQTLLLDRLN